MSIECICPLPASLTDIPVKDCPFDLGQIVKIAFQRIDDTANSFVDGTNDIAELASWQAFRTATDNTSIELTPLFDNFLIPAGEALTEGGNDNTTIDGQQLIVGQGFIQASGTFRQLKKEIIAALKDYQCELNLGVYLINSFGEVIARDLDTTPNASYGPIPITSFFISDTDVQGYATQNKNNFVFNLAGSWSETVVKPPLNFDARTELA